MVVILFKKFVYGNMTLIFYSHKDYSDIWPVLFNQTNKYFDSSFKKILFTNDGDVPDGWDVVYYDDSKSYQDRFISCLQKLEDDIIIYHHEDMFLYGQPDIDYIKRLYWLIEKQSYSFVKLIKTGANQGIEVGDNLFEMSKDAKDYFAIQPTIWNRKKLIDVYKNAGGDSIWQFENSAGVYCLHNKIKGLFCYDKLKDNPRGGHYDSSVYPYIATAVVKGKWNYKEYEKELVTIFKENSYQPTREVLR